MVELAVFEEFMPNIEEIREHALAASYEDWPGPDGEVYKRICITEIPGLRAKIESVVGPVDMLGMAYRLNYKGELPNATIHTDLGWGTHALVLYLNDGESGTAFWRHSKTGAKSVTEKQLELLQIVETDWNYPDAWEMRNLIGMRKNRALIYESKLFHSRYPFKAFGNSPETGRLIAVAFFTPKERVMIRKAEDKDLRRLVEMSERFYPSTHYAQSMPFDATSVAVLCGILQESGIMLVAEVDDKVVGFVGLATMPFMFNPDYVGAYEVVWWVEPEYQSEGVGKALLEAIEPAAKERGCAFIQMIHLPTSPPKAAALYEKLGYNHSETSYTKVI